MRKMPVPKRIIGQRGNLRALAAICEFHFLGRPQISIDCLKHHQDRARLPQSKKCRLL